MDGTVLELGKAGSSGVEKGVIPVLSGGAVVATLRASNWKESATAVVGDRTWVFGKQSRELTARWEADPEDSVRLRACQESFWKGSWTVDLEGILVEVVTASWWKGTRRYSAAGQLVAESSTTGGRAMRPALTPAPQLPLDHAVFLLWIERVLGRRSAAAAAA
ncbi:hypothetical protein [Modestobacter marinus]|uniref:hypothetical protein n=1 Tax=Modestobacter marinus TaxID=477641 RepID=UPI0021BBBB26|nr:hypothetical protein [Modestobacter marinus]